MLSILHSIYTMLFNNNLTMFQLYSERATLEKIKKMSIWQGSGESKQGMNRWGPKDFQESESLLCDNVMVDTLYFVKPCKMQNKGVNSNIKYGFYSIITQQYLFINCNQCTILILTTGGSWRAIESTCALSVLHFKFL